MTTITPAKPPQPWAHQTRALEFIRDKPGAMLAMEMGTGKTRVAIDHMEELEAVFGKQWGAYEDNPLVTEQGLTIPRARETDPVSNGKGGALLDGRLWREFPEEEKKHE